MTCVSYLSSRCGLGLKLFLVHLRIEIELLMCCVYGGSRACQDRSEHKEIIVSPFLRISENCLS